MHTLLTIQSNALGIKCACFILIQWITQKKSRDILINPIVSRQFVIPFEEKKETLHIATQIHITTNLKQIPALRKQEKKQNERHVGRRSV